MNIQFKRELYEPLINNESKVLFHIGSKPPPTKPGYIRVVTMGNTYGGSLGNVPFGDIFIHTGNFTSEGRADEAYQFVHCVSLLPHRYKVVVPGVAESIAVKDIMMELSAPSVLYLDGTTTLLCGLRICSAMTIVRDDILAHRPFDAVSDIVISHVPPYKILDENEFGVNIGIQSIAKNIEVYRPLVCLSGFIGSGHGALWDNDTLHVNSSIYGWSELDAKYIRYGVPLVIDIPSKQRTYSIGI